MTIPSGAGTGNDTLKGGAGNDLFIYSGGNDVITDYVSGEDVISLGGAISKSSISGDNVILTIGKNTLTLRNSKYDDIRFISATGEEYTEIFGGLQLNNSLPSKVTLKAGVEFANAGTRTTSIAIKGNELNNTIYGGSGKDTLFGEDGADSLLGGKEVDKLHGGDGADTLIGGLGNDTLWGDEGSDVFFYANGDGKDVISDFEEDDMLQIIGIFSASLNSAGNVIFKVGSTAGAITLKNAKETGTFNINGDEYEINGTKLVKREE